jgi:uncharacterized membrane protein
MNLPPLSIPEFPLPITIPEMMHPAIVHFAVALPVVILLIELINLAARRKSIGAISFVLIVLMAVVYLGAYLTGTVDAEAAKGLGTEAKSVLDGHKNGGIWLVYASLVVLLFKLISSGVGKFPVRIVFLVVLGLFFWGATGVVKKGCALTYKHGVNVKRDAAASAPAQETEPTAVKTEAEAPAHEAAQPAAEKPVADETAHEATKQTVETAQEKAEAAAETLKEKAAEATEAVDEKVTQAADAAHEKAAQATDAVEEKAAEVTEAAKEKATEAVEKAKETIEKAAMPSAEAPQTPAEHTPAPTPVETPPAG